MYPFRPLKAFRPVLAPSDAGCQAVPPAPEQNPDVRLRLVADTVETLAYDLAVSQPPDVVSQLIVIAAELDRLADVIERGNPQHTTLLNR